MSENRPADKEKREDSINNRIPRIEDNESVWMKAMVVNFKLCDRSYDCLNCSFDKAMRDAWDQDANREEK
jgi:hypothetical protein